MQDSLTYDPISDWLDGLCRKLDKAEAEMMTDPQHAYQTGATDRWWLAYLAYHCARIDAEVAEWIPCDECDGDGFHTAYVPPSDIWRDFPGSAEMPCKKCGGSGKMPCGYCGENPAVATNAAHDALCAKCAGEER